ncbi:hypothetical protein KIPB_015040, partial [Kipferlia bialata]
EVFARDPATSEAWQALPKEKKEVFSRVVKGGFNRAIKAIDRATAESLQGGALKPLADNIIHHEMVELARENETRLPMSSQHIETSVEQHRRTDAELLKESEALVESNK